MKCKRHDCERPAAPQQVYCSREHAPYGLMFGKNPNESREDRAWRMYSRMKACADLGKSQGDTAVLLALNEGTVREYAKITGIKFQSARGKRKPHAQAG